VDSVSELSDGNNCKHNNSNSNKEQEHPRDLVEGSYVHVLSSAYIWYRDLWEMVAPSEGTL